MSLVDGFGDVVGEVDESFCWIFCVFERIVFLWCVVGKKKVVLVEVLGGLVEVFVVGVNVFYVVIIKDEVLGWFF